ncbi:MAG: TolC family protein [Deltaproteobacteria bacterium]|nr:TolC family protein [Deltaproteobacteria bacterium]
MHAVRPTRTNASLIAAPLALLLGAADPDAPVERTPHALAAHARTHSPRARAAALEQQAARRAVDAAGAWFDPMLELRAAPLSVPGLLPADAHDERTFGAELMLAQRLPLSGRLGHERERASADAARVRADADLVLLDLEREAALLACDAWEATANTRVRRRHVEVLRAMADVARAQIAVGRATVGDAQRLDAEVARLSVEVLEGEGELAAVDVETNLLLGRAPAAPLGAPGEQVPWLADEPATLHVEARDEVRGGSARLAAAEAERARAADAWIPDLTASAGWSTMWPLSHALMLGVALELPVWNGAKSAELDAASVMRDQADAMLDEARVRVAAELAVARTRDDAAAKVLALLQDKVVPLAAARAQTARAALSGGAALDAALDATHEERETDLQLVGATAAHCRTRAELWRASGASFLPSSQSSLAPTVTP